MQLVGVLGNPQSVGFWNEALRVARLRLDAGEAPSGELTLEAAHAANHAGDPELGGQLAELALADKGGRDSGDGPRRVAAAGRAASRRGSDAGGSGTPRSQRSGEWTATPISVSACSSGSCGGPHLVAALLDRMLGWSEEGQWQRFIGRLRNSYGPGAQGIGDVATSEAIASNPEIPEPARRLAAAMHRVGLVVTGDGDLAAESAFADIPAPPFHDDADVAGLASLVFASLKTTKRGGELESYLSRVIHEAVRQRARAASGGCGGPRIRQLRACTSGGVAIATLPAGLLRRSSSSCEPIPFNTMVVVRANAVGVAAFTGDFEGTIAAHDRLQSWIAHREPLAVQQPMVARAAGWAAHLAGPRGSESATAGRR